MYHFGLVVFALTVATAYAWDALNPEQALFAYTRCMEMYLDNVDPAKRSASFEKWRSWNLQKDNDNTECYALCVLERLELFDGQNFQPHRVAIQYEAYKDDTKATEQERDDLKAAIEKMAKISDPSCNNVYDTIVENIPALKPGLLKIYLGDKALTTPIYAKTTDIRQRDQSYFEYCEKKYYGGAGDKDTLCKIRQYNVIDDSKFAEHTDCLFKGLRYFTRDGQLNQTEIERDFRLADQESQIGSLQNIILSCDKSTPISVYKCLVADKSSDFFKAFQEAFDYREIRSRDYSHRIKNPTYNRDAITSGVSDIDSSICS